MAIENEEEFEAWLKEQPRETCILIAARAALRVFPIVTRGTGLDAELEQLTLLAARAILASGVRAKMPIPEVKAAAEALARSAIDGLDRTVPNGLASIIGREATYTHALSRAAANTTDAATRAAAGTAETASTALIAIPVKTVATAVSATVRAAASAAAFATARVVDAAYASRVTDATHDAARADAKTDFNVLFETALWHEPKEPDWLISLTKERHDILISGPDWTFWRDWYQGFVIGKPVDLELQRRVASIPDPIWEAGPRAVAEEIERIRAAFLAEKAPQAERVEFNPETQKFFTVPVEMAKPDLLGATLSQVQDALDDVLANPSNGLHDNAREVRVLRRVFTKYGNDPQQIEMGFNSVYKGLTRQILTEELPRSEENLALQEMVAEGARGIRATHPEVAENRKILNEQAIRELPDDGVELLEDARPLLEAISKEELAEDWAQDIPQLINDATLPLPSGAPPLPGADETTRIFSRVSKMKLLYDKLVTKGAATFDSKGMKTARLGLTVGGVLLALVKLGLFLFGVL